MAYHNDYKVLHHETDSGEWQSLVLRFMDKWEGYDIPNQEVIPFLASHHIFVTTVYPDRFKYIPATSKNIEKLDNLIDRQKVLFSIAVNEFNSCENKTETGETKLLPEATKVI